MTCRTGQKPRFGFMFPACAVIWVAGAAELLAEAAGLQRERGCVTSADLTPLVQEAEATCLAELGAADDRIRQSDE